MKILAIDPGDEYSAFVIMDEKFKPILFDKILNQELISRLGQTQFDAIYIEMIASYGMPVGAEVFETCVWIGRFMERLHAPKIERINRKEVSLHHCHSAKAKDSNVIRALVDRFAYGQSNFGKGTKNDPGWFHGFSKDVWQAYALGVCAVDRMKASGKV